MFCSSCAASLPEGANYCPQCGTPPDKVEQPLSEEERTRLRQNLSLMGYNFGCSWCNHSTIIYFETQFYPDEVGIDDYCSRCLTYGQLNNGDMGYRSDYPRPMYPPWQYQTVPVNSAKRFCKECSEVKRATIKDAEPQCYQCGKRMLYISTSSEELPDSLIALIKRL